MYAMYRDGATLDQVGTEFGLTRERVRQLFAANDLETISLAVRRRRQAENKSSEIVALYRDVRNVDAVGRRLGLAKSNVDQIVRRELSPAERRKPSAAHKKKYSNEELIACLFGARDAIGGVLTTSAYTRYARSRHFEDGRPWPTHQTFLLRWGGWRKALAEAGLARNPSSPIAGQRLFEAEHCVDALRHAARELGKAPTAAAYDDLAQRSGGALPSQATVRNRLGTWNRALLKAGL